MRKRISPREEKVFKKEYNKWMRELCSQLIDQRENMIEVMKDMDLKTFKEDADFINMAKYAVFEKLQLFYKQEAAMEGVQEIINSEDDNDD